MSLALHCAMCAISVVIAAFVMVMSHYLKNLGILDWKLIEESSHWNVNEVATKAFLQAKH